VIVVGLPRLPNPTGIPSANDLSYGGLAGAAWVLAWACLLAAAVSVFIRYRRSADEQRLQLKWFAMPRH
jgi:membrane protein CcdC involved in cytochrome C biogenesis